MWSDLELNGVVALSRRLHSPYRVFLKDIAILALAAIVRLHGQLTAKNTCLDTCTTCYKWRIVLDRIETQNFKEVGPTNEQPTFSHLQKARS